jgi:hypothetical protein
MAWNVHSRVLDWAGKLAESRDGNERGNVARLNGGEVPQQRISLPSLSRRGVDRKHMD